MLKKYKKILHISGIRHQIIDDILFYRTKILTIKDKLLMGNISLYEIKKHIYKYDIIIFHFIDKLDIEKLFSIIKEFPDKKYGLYLHTFYPFSEDGTFLKRTYTIDIMKFNFIKKLNFIIVQDNYSYEFVEKYLILKGFKNINIFILKQGINTKNLLYKKYNFLTFFYKKPKKIIFGFIGSFSYIKGYEIFKNFLLKYGNYFNKNGISFSLYTLDKPGDNINLDEIFSIKRKTKNIEITFDEFNRKVIYSKIDCLIIPSLWNETGPMVLYEAFANKLPVIVSDQKSLKEKVINRVDSYVFKTGDEKDLLKGILWMKENYNKVILNNKGFKYNKIENYNNQLNQILNEL